MSRETLPLLKTIEIDRSKTQFRLVSALNIIILIGAMEAAGNIFLGAAKAFMNGNIEDLSISMLGAVLFAFPAWVAWKNIDIVRAVSEIFTISSQLYLSVLLIAIAFLMAMNAIQNADSAAIWYSRSAPYAGVGFLALITATTLIRARRRKIPSLGINLKELMQFIEKPYRP